MPFRRDLTSMLLLEQRRRRQTALGIGVLILAGIAGYLIVRKSLKEYSELQRAKDRTKTGDDELGTVLKNENPSFPVSQYDQWVSKMLTASGGCGTDSEQILAVFNKLRNNADFLMLKSRFNIQTWDACNWAFDFGDNKGDMQTLLSKELTPAEISKVNSILATKGIAYRV